MAAAADCAPFRGDTAQDLARLGRHLQRRYPRHLAGWDESELERAVRMSAAAAGALGLAEPQTVASFVTLDLTTHHHFHRQPQIRRCLEASRGRPDSERLLEMLREVPPQIWLAARNPVRPRR